jgi:hypothetical protein
VLTPSPLVNRWLLLVTTKKSPVLIPLTVTAAPTGDVAPPASLNIESSDIKKSKINLFFPPTVVVPNPTIHQSHLNMSQHLH